MTGREPITVGTYVRAVERWWGELCERPPILSPREWTLVERWHQRGIPLQVIREAIEAASERRRRPGATAPKSLTYLVPAVEEGWRVVVAGRLVSPPDPPEEPRPPGGGIDAWRSAVAAVGPSSALGELLEGLLHRFDEGAPPQELEKRIEEAILDVAPSDERERVRAGLEAEMAPYRGRMSENEYESTVRKAWIRRLRLRLGLPRLDAPDPGEEKPA